MKTGIELIAEERARQISKEGYSPAHDDLQENGEFIDAAICYANFASGVYTPKCWPWSETAWETSADPIRNLVKAGALIAAEIDRLQRRNSKSC